MTLPVTLPVDLAVNLPVDLAANLPVNLRLTRGMPAGMLDEMASRSGLDRIFAFSLQPRRARPAGVAWRCSVQAALPTRYVVTGPRAAGTDRAWLMQCGRLGDGARHCTGTPVRPDVMTGPLLRRRLRCETWKSPADRTSAVLALGLLR